MKIFRAIGLGLMLIILSILMPDVYAGLESALVKFFATLVDVMGQFPDATGETAMIYPHAIPMPQ